MLFKHQDVIGVGEFRGWWYGGFAFSIMVNGIVNERVYEQRHKEKDRLKKARKDKIKISLERNLVSRPN